MLIHNFSICKVVWFNFKICWISQNPDKFLIYFYFVEIKNVGYWSCAVEAKLEKGPMEKSSTCRFRIVNNNLGCYIIYSPFICLFVKPWCSNKYTFIQHLHLKTNWNSSLSRNTLIISRSLARDLLARCQQKCTDIVRGLFMGELNFCCTLSCLQEGGNKKILLWRQWRITHVEMSMTLNILQLKPSLKFEAR